MRRTPRHLLVPVAFSVAYLLVFPILTGRELVIQRSWAVPVASAPVVSDSVRTAGVLLPVRFDDSFAYVSDDGAVIYRGAITYRVALAGRGFISFGRTPDQLVLQNPDGSYLATIPQSGYPQFIGAGLFVMSGRDTVVTAYSLGGEPRWRESLEGPLSSICADGGITVLGLLSGGIVAIDDTGERIDIEGVDNRYAITVYGSAIHALSGTVAAVLGPTDPALVLYDLRNNRFTPSLRIDLRGNPSSSMAVEMTRDGQYVVFDDRGVRMVRVASGAESAVPTRYPLEQIETGVGFGLVATLGLGEERDPQRGFRLPAEFVLFDHDGVVPVRAAFSADRAFLSTTDGNSYLGIDDRVLRFKMGVE
ncbi:MAG: hypothetical protein V3S41_02075 [Spirochaetia bacterium]